MSGNTDSQKCHICGSRKARKSCLPAIVNTAEIDCSQHHRFCWNCIHLYSTIDTKCPLCASNYSHYSKIESGVKVNKQLTEKSDNNELSEEEKKMYIDYLETISDLSSEEELEEKDNKNGENAERRIRNRIKQMKRLLHCNGVHCNSKECLSGEHDEDCSEAIEEFHVGEYEWQEANAHPTNGSEKKLKREKTFEELLDECEQFVESAIKEEEQ